MFRKFILVVDGTKHVRSGRCKKSENIKIEGSAVEICIGQVELCVLSEFQLGSERIQ